MFHITVLHALLRAEISWFHFDFAAQAAHSDITDTELNCFPTFCPGLDLQRKRRCVNVEPHGLDLPDVEGAR